jgi:Lon protease-like protein
MKKFLLALCLSLVGCSGQSYHVQDVQNGRVVSETKGGIGWRAVDITTSTNDQLLETCLAELGAHPRAKAYCEEIVRLELVRRERQLGGYTTYAPSYYASP